MNYSAILVVARPGALETLPGRLRAISGVEVHRTDAPTRRLICTIEAPSVDDEVRIFRQIRELDGVFDASLLEHRPDPESTGETSCPSPETLG